MPLTIPPESGIVAFQMRYSTDPETMICTMGVRPLEPPFGLGHLDRLIDLWSTHVMVGLSDAVTFIGATARITDESADGDRIYELPVNPVIAGSQGLGASQNVAFLVEKLTTRAGRRGRGRMFLPGVPESQVDQAGNVVSTSLNAANTALALFVAQADDAGGGLRAGQPVELLLLHGNTTSSTTEVTGTTRTVTTTQGAAGPLPDVITGLQYDPKVATQRRRLR